MSWPPPVMAGTDWRMVCAYGPDGERSWRRARRVSRGGQIGAVRRLERLTLDEQGEVVCRCCTRWLSLAELEAHAIARATVHVEAMDLGDGDGAA